MSLSFPFLQAELTAEQELEVVVGLAERYYDRVDAALFLELLPPDMPLAGLLRYFKIVLEYGSAKKRNLQVGNIFFNLHHFSSILW